MERYYYEATVLEILDGNTITLDIDLGFNMRVIKIVRLYGLNCPELTINNRVNPLGTAALQFTESRIKSGDKVFIKTLKDRQEEFGRILVIVFYPHTTPGTFRCLNKEILDANHAVPFMQTKTKYW